LVWNSGSAANTVLPGCIRSAETIIQALATSLACVRAASFGVPVVPPVCR
jgi:undecaprenyl pyrophosphate phosphatase UppP